MRRINYFLILLAIAVMANGFVCCLPRMHHGHSSHQSHCCMTKTARSGQVAGDNDNTLRYVLISATSESDPIEFPLIHYKIEKAQISEPELASKLNGLTCSRIFISRKDFV